MKITIYPTDVMTKVNGTPCRMWKGVTEKGVLCDVFVPALRVRSDADCSEFDAELKELPQPTTTEAIDLRFLIA